MPLRGPLNEPFVIRPEELMAEAGRPPWTKELLEDGRNAVHLVCAEPGQTDDAHVHPDFAQWWIVLKGEVVWEIGDFEPIHAGRGDIVYCPVGQRQFIKAVGSETTLRVAVSRPGSSHDVKGERGPAPVPIPENMSPPNMLHTKLSAALAHFGEPPWSKVVVLDKRNRANLICHAPGQTNRAHWHPEFDEWWPVLDGELTWQMGNRPAVMARKGDIVFCPKGFRHHIVTVGDKTSVRLAVTPPQAPHVYTDEDDAAPPPRE